MKCEHPIERLMQSVDYPGKLFCRSCEKRFEYVKGTNHFVEWEKPEQPSVERKCSCDVLTPFICIWCRTAPMEKMISETYKAHKPPKEVSRRTFDALSTQVDAIQADQEKNEDDEYKWRKALLDHLDKQAITPIGTEYLRERFL